MTDSKCVRMIDKEHAELRKEAIAARRYSARVSVEYLDRALAKIDTLLAERDAARVQLVVIAELAESLYQDTRRWAAGHIRDRARAASEGRPFVDPVIAAGEE